MKNLLFILILVIGPNAFGQVVPRTAKSPIDFVPAGYVVFQKIQGDLNKDNQMDAVLIIKGTDKTKFVKNTGGEIVDRNRRGIIIAFKNHGHYELMLVNRDCFSSENEDGGVYFPPELSFSIEKGNLIFHYAGGRYGYSDYVFRYQNFDFDLIGYDDSEDSGPLVENFVSINFLTKKMLKKDNLNQDPDADDKFKETWSKFALSKPIKLREIADFDNFDVMSLLGSAK